jgi:hypothetical protein
MNHSTPPDREPNSTSTLPPGVLVVRKHHFLVRWSHWLNVPILLGLILSGISIYGSKAWVLEHRKHIRCRKIFAVAGNHDKEARKLTEEFSWLNNLAEISIHGQLIVLCHYAMRVWSRSHHGSWHLYGHSHGRLPEPPTSLSMDVGVDTHDFRPWHYDEISRLMTARAKARSEQNASPDSNSQCDTALVLFCRDRLHRL